MTEELHDLAANKATVLRYMRASQRNDSETMAEILHEDCLRYFPRPGLHADFTTRGSDNIIGRLPHRGHYQAGTLEMNVENMVAEGPFVTIQFSLKAKTADARDYENFYIYQYELHGGRITKFYEYCDTMYGAQMLRPDAVRDAAASL